MGFCTIGAVFDSIHGVDKASAAAVTQCVQGAIAEQATEVFILYALMAGKILAFTILEKLIVLHFELLRPLSTDKFPAADEKTPSFRLFSDG